jgi:hypothetical protein
MIMQKAELSLDDSSERSRQAAEESFGLTGQTFGTVAYRV